MKRIGRLASLGEEIAAAESLISARDGDTRLLEKRLGSGEATAEECAFDTDLKAGKINKPRHRPATLRVALRRERVKRFLTIALADKRAGANPWQMKAIVAEAVKLSRGSFSRWKVWELIKELRAAP